MTHDIYIYILVAAAVSCLIRVLPLTLIRRKIKNPFLRSFILCAVCYPCGDDLSGHHNGAAGSSGGNPGPGDGSGGRLAGREHDRDCGAVLRGGLCV